MSDSYRRASDALLTAIGEFVKTGKPFDKEWHKAAEEAFLDLDEERAAKQKERRQ
jgi:hypothetical protein